jgi:hypothetical protein
MVLHSLGSAVKLFVFSSVVDGHSPREAMLPRLKSLLLMGYAFNSSFDVDIMMLLSLCGVWVCFFSELATRLKDGSCCARTDENILMLKVY